ncbi:MAG: ABC transporter permease [Dehalococcoidales bacterium]|nr:ABC transporter permease [Dehalococcoidales bacterium]
MKEILIIFQRDFREIRQSNAFRIICGLSLLFLLGVSLGASIALNRLSWLGEPAARPFLIMITGIIAYFVPLFIMMAFIWAFASLPVTREKANGNIECLIATPISPRTLWLGKSLAIFLPGFLISCIYPALLRA